MTVPISAWYMCKCQPKANHRLYCFPHAGGGSQPYLQWQSMLAPHTEVRVIQLPGRGERFREPLTASFFDLVAEFAESIDNTADGPFSLFGHSLGALLSYEVAHMLCISEGQRPERLIVSGCEAAHLKQRSNHYQHLSDAELLDLLQQLDGSPHEILSNPELIELLLPSIRYDFALLDQYVHRHDTLLDLPLTVLSGLDDDHIELEHVPRWKELTAGACDVHWYDGGHFFLEENFDDIAIKLHPAA